nr:stalk domain-containing protein [Paenibacillus caui]
MISSFTGHSAAAAANKAEPAPIAVQGALDAEIESLLKAMGQYKTQKVGMYSYYIGKIDGIPVIVNRTEMGMVNASTATTLLIETFHPRAIINQGTAGGHDEKTHLYDIVVGKEQINYINTITPIRKKGEGSKPETWNMMTTDVRDDNDNLLKYKTFKSTPELVQAAMSVKDKYMHGDVMTGTIGSADQFNNEVDRILWTNEVLGMTAEDMETAAVAQVANGFHVPFVGIRGMSDAGRHDEHWNPESGRNAAIWTGEYVVEVIKAIDKQVNFATITQVNGYNLYVNNVKQDIYLLDYKGNALIPVRNLANVLSGTKGTRVTYDSKTRSISFKYDTKTATFKAGDSFFLDTQGTKQQVKSPSVSVNGKAYVSLDFVAKAFGLETKVDGVDLYITAQ